MKKLTALFLSLGAASCAVRLQRAERQQRQRVLRRRLRKLGRRLLPAMLMQAPATQPECFRSAQRPRPRTNRSSA